MKAILSTLIGLTLLANTIAFISSGYKKQDVRVSRVDPSDSMALVAIYNSTNGPNWTTTWDLQRPVSEWHGVTLDGSGTKVVSLRLDNNGLDGFLPQAIGRLEGLVKLRLPNNNIKGSLPDSLAYLANLRELILYNNQIKGALPDSIQHMVSLKMISLTDNLLDLPLPKTLGQLSQLEVLILSNNAISGSIPESLGAMVSLRTLNLSNNQLSGSLPSSLGQLLSLQECLLTNNNLRGKVPNSIAQLSALQYLWLDYNQLSDTFPTIDLQNLVSLRINNNSFNGLPDFTHLPSIYRKNPDGITVVHNPLSFEDLLPNLPLADSARFDFSPLDTIDIRDTFYVSVGDAFTYTLPFDDTLTTNTYTWFHYQNKKELTRVNEYVIPQVQFIDAGDYHCQVTNSILDSVTLTTYSFTLKVRGNSGCGDPPPADECFLADIQCALQKLDQYCAQTDQNRPREIFSFCGKLFSLQDRDWFAFTAGASKARIRITPFSCSDLPNSGIVAFVFEDCTLGTPLNCDTTCTQSTIDISLDNLTVGKDYYLLVGGCEGGCYYQINIKKGGQGIQLEDPGPLSGPDSICDYNLFYTYSLDKSIDEVDKYEWIVTGEEPVYTLLPKLNTQWANPGINHLCVRGIGSCDTTEYSCLDIQLFPQLTYDNFKTEKAPDNTSYFVEFRVRGGIPPYLITGAGGTYNAVNRTFTTELIPCGTPYDIQVKDGNNCSFRITGVEYCSCTSEAGTLQGDSLTVCEGSAFKVFHNNNAVLDSNDIGVFIWYEMVKNGDFRNIIEINDNGVFHYNAQVVELGKPYRVQYVVSSQTSNGGIDWQDPCLDTTPAIIITYQKRPKAFAGKDTTVCFGNFNLNARFTSSGSTGRWSFASGPDTPVIQHPRDPHSLVRIITPGRYHFFWVEQQASCVDGDSVTIQVKPPLQFQVEGARALCEGRQTTLHISNPFRHYQWSTGDTSDQIIVTQPGFYGITVTDNYDCTASETIEVKNKKGPQPIISGNNQACSGDTLLFKVKQSYFSYRWSNGDIGPIARVSQQGIICVTVTDVDGCEGDDCTEVTFNPTSTDFRTIELCSGDSLLIEGKTFKDSGHYEIQLQEPNQYGCDSILVLDISNFPAILLEDTLIVHDNGSHQGLINVQISGGKKPYIYRWSTGQTTPFIKNLSSGDYTLTLTDANGCSRVFTFTIIDLTSSYTPSSHYGIDLKWYPSMVQKGASSQLDFRAESPLKLEVSIRSLQGKTLLKKKVTTQDKWQSLPISADMPKGVYIVSISLRGNIIRTWRWIVI